VSSEPIRFHKIWIEQCEAAQDIRERFGRHDAMDYLIGEKLLHFVHASEQDREFSGELPAFVTEIRRLFTADEIREYLSGLEKSKYFAAPEPLLELDECEEDDGELWPANPVMGAEELLRFFRIRQLLQQ
jgi:hypothetical protein